MKTKILILGLICLFIFTHCNSPADPEIEKALNPGPDESISYSCQFDLIISHNVSATGNFCVSLLESTPTGSPQLMSLGVLNFSPLLDNPDVSEGTASFLETIPTVPSETYVLCLYLVQYNDLEQYQVTPGEWVIEATISEGFEFVTGGSFTSVQYGLVQVGRGTAWLTFSVSD